MQKLLGRRAKVAVFGLLMIGGLSAGIGMYSSRNSQAADIMVNATVNLDQVVRQISPTDIGVGSSTYGSNPLSSAAQSTAEQNLDAQYIRLPVGIRNGRVTSSAGGGPTDLDIPALVRLYHSWGYRTLVVIGGRSNDADVQPGDATQIINALGMNNIDYTAPNEVGNQGLSVQDEINLAKMIVAEGKAIDPNFKIWGPVWAYYDRNAIKTFAQSLGNDLGGVDYHNYAMGSTSLSTTEALANTPSYAQQIGEIKDDLAGLGLNVPVNVDELNFSWRYDDGTPGGNNRFFTTINTVWMSSALGHILEAGGRGLPYATQNGPLGVMVEGGNVNPDNRAASSPMPAYWGISAWTGGKIWPHYNNAMYATSYADSTGEVFAVNNQAGGYNIVLLNKSETDSKTLSLNVRGIASGTYKAYQTNEATPYDAPVIIDEAAYSNTGSKTFSLPKMSMTVIVVSPGASVSATSMPTARVGDLNNDGKVNVFDLSLLLGAWGKTGSADLNKDGKVDIFDLSLLLSNWTG
ncbi:MAG: hypothetical protein NVSMB39_5110 [Candidatus Saccharimonadales bacterium]